MLDVFNSKRKKVKRKDSSPPGKVGLARRSNGRKTVVFPRGKKRYSMKGHSHNPLSSYLSYPDKVKFINKDKEEKVILLLRKHPVTNTYWIFISFFMLLAPFFFPMLTFFNGLPFAFKSVLVLIWYLITLALILEGFLAWFFHVNIITDERIIEVDFVNLLYREITDANIADVQDVTVEVGGALRTYMNYGDIIVQTAAQIPKIEFEAVPKPDEVARILRELRVEEEIERLEGRVR